MKDLKKECKQLWKEVFGDEDEFIDHFLTHYYQEENMLCIEQNGHIISMLHLLPFTCNGTSVGMIYALATAPRARGKGCATTLLQASIEKGRQAGCKAIVLIPENDNLHTFYEKTGFKGKYPVELHQPTDFNFGLDDKAHERMKILPITADFDMPASDSIIHLHYDKKP